MPPRFTVFSNHWGKNFAAGKGPWKTTILQAVKDPDPRERAASFDLLRQGLKALYVLSGDNSQYVSVFDRSITMSRDEFQRIMTIGDNVEDVITDELVALIARNVPPGNRNGQRLDKNTKKFEQMIRNLMMSGQITGNYTDQLVSLSHGNPIDAGFKILDTNGPSYFAPSPFKQICKRTIPTAIMDGDMQIPIIQETGGFECKLTNPEHKFGDSSGMCNVDTDCKSNDNDLKCDSDLKVCVVKDALRQCAPLSMDINISLPPLNGIQRPPYVIHNLAAARTENRRVAESWENPQQTKNRCDPASAFGHRLWVQDPIIFVMGGREIDSHFVSKDTWFNELKNSTKLHLDIGQYIDEDLPILARVRPDNPFNNPYFLYWKFPDDEDQKVLVRYYVEGTQDFVSPTLYEAVLGIPKPDTDEANEINARRHSAIRARRNGRQSPQQDQNEEEQKDQQPRQGDRNKNPFSAQQALVQFNENDLVQDLEPDNEQGDDAQNLQPNNEQGGFDAQGFDDDDLIAPRENLDVLPPPRNIDSIIDAEVAEVDQFEQADEDAVDKAYLDELAANKDNDDDAIQNQSASATVDSPRSVSPPPNALPINTVPELSTPVAPVGPEIVLATTNPEPSPKTKVIQLDVSKEAETVAELPASSKNIGRYSRRKQSDPRSTNSSPLDTIPSTDQILDPAAFRLQTTQDADMAIAKLQQKSNQPSVPNVAETSSMQFDRLFEEFQSKQRMEREASLQKQRDEYVRNESKEPYNDQEQPTDRSRIANTNAFQQAVVSTKPQSTDTSSIVSPRSKRGRSGTSMYGMLSKPSTDVTPAEKKSRLRRNAPKRANRVYNEIGQENNLGTANDPTPSPRKRTRSETSVAATPTLNK